MNNSYLRYFQNAVAASRQNIPPEVINQVLNSVALAAVESAGLILQKNQKDLDKMNPADPKFDRLKLTDGRIKDIAGDIRNVAKLENPLGKIILKNTMPNGLHISKVTVPLGVVGIVYEARPNVTFDVFSICFKSGNTCILKGGSDAENSNRAIADIIHAVLRRYQLDENILTLLPPEREATAALLNATGFVDVLIPRGSQQLINYVRDNSKVPVIETGAGIVHTYFDESADLEKGKAIIFNAKTRRVSVCNALDCLIINRERLDDLAGLVKQLADTKTEIYADEPAFGQLNSDYPANLLHHASPGDFGTEFLAMKLAVKTVDNLEQALEHISQYSSKHSEAIISEDTTHIERFLNSVDAAAVYVNASTAFTDGAQFGLGAEIGISTQKLHSRGPMGLQELTSYKWIVRGNGQVRA